MSVKSALRWSLYDRALALLPFLLGIAIFAGGVWLGAGSYLYELGFGDMSDAGQPANPMLIAVGAVLGLIVWQIGRSAVRHHTLQKALDAEAVVDEERVASAAANKVDDRLSEVESDVQQVSRQTSRLEREVRGDDADAGYDGAGFDDDTAAGAGGTAVGTGTDDTTAETTTATTDASASASTADDSDDGAASGTPGTVDDGAADDTESADDDSSEDEDDAADDRGEDTAGSDDDFEWEDDEDGEYYRNG